MRLSLIKKVVVIVGLLIICMNVNAQTYSNKPSSILSFSAGLTSSNYYVDSLSFKTGILFYGGFSYSIVLNERLNVALDLAYTGKGFKTTSPIVKYRCYFVELPIYAQIKLGENIRINAGAQVSYATNSNRISIDQTKTNGVRSDQIDNPVDFDYAILAGAEFDISKDIGIGARYSYSPLALPDGSGGFGCFQLHVKYSPIKTYKVFFGKNKTQQ